MDLAFLITILKNIFKNKNSILLILKLRELYRVFNYYIFAL